MDAYCTTKTGFEVSTEDANIAYLRWPDIGF